MKTSPRRRRFYIITAAIFVAILGFSVLIVEYVNYSYVKIEVTGSSDASFVVSYDSTSATINASQNAAIEVLPHANVTVTAYPVASYGVVNWSVNGATATGKGPDAIDFVTGQGGSTIKVSAELAANSSG